MSVRRVVRMVLILIGPGTGNDGIIIFFFVHFLFFPSYSPLFLLLNGPRTLLYRSRRTRERCLCVCICQPCKLIVIRLLPAIVSVVVRTCANPSLALLPSIFRRNSPTYEVIYYYYYYEKFDTWPSA